MAKFSREMLSKFSKKQLVGIVISQQAEIVTLREKYAQLRGEHVQLRARMLQLEQRVGINSRNSSKPPSSDGPDVAKPERKNKSKRKRGGQPGHEGHDRKLLPTDEVDQEVVVKPDVCEHCGCKLDGDDPWPGRHQVWELPEVKPEVTEYQLHALVCGRCGERTTAPLPEGVSPSVFGPQLHAVVAILTGVYRLSHRSVQSMLEDLYHIPMGLGSVSACERRMSEALEQPVREVLQYVQSADVVCADETSWRQCNNKAWLWAAVTCTATYFMIHTRRNQQAARKLLGAFSGTLVTDRYCAYNFYGFLRQLCWAHLKRDFTRFSEYGGQAGAIGAQLLAQVDQMFTWWHKVRDGTIQRKTFQRYMRPLRAEVEQLLRDGTQCGHAKMEGSCNAILKQARWLWTFVNVPGVEPTNNAAERAVRPGVLRRKTSFGTQSAAGSRYIERVMTAAATRKQQDRNITQYLAQAYLSHLHARPAPSLFPTQTAGHTTQAA